ncbi:hypothetical protein HYH03_006834 [Edaphochlamys debaryana]|uniref:Uncharacterized protein n=1 Tax=Edaphochlamys debaryana TaxID=47281 RepID=A0A835YCB5_9CHLO|nr:hypothetical protein HYH03_006834 [Edaphochlamys debaryana]|eukprot:KAG2494899.1 hypothetical protein HYH03_006834 [Edaphochlamys debaryana]
MEICGLGDRLRGITFAVRIAAATKRVLLVYQEAPAPLEHFLSPTHIDWRLTPDLGIDPRRDLVESARHLKFRATVDKRRVDGHLRNGTLPLLPQRFVTIATNMPPTYRGNVSDDQQLPPVPVEMQGELTRALFKLSPELEAATDAALASVGVAPGQPFVAAHLRLGGQVGETKAIQRHLHNNTHTLVKAAARCARWLRGGLPANGTDASAGSHAGRARAGTGSAEGSSGGAAGGTVAEGWAAVIPERGGGGAFRRPPLVLITDNLHLREMAIARQLGNWISPNITPVHLRLNKVQNPHGPKPSAGAAAPLGAAASNGGALAGPAPGAMSAEELQAVIRMHIASMADFGILVRAPCLLQSRSGFSHLAALLGGQSCTALLEPSETNTAQLCPQA